MKPIPSPRGYPIIGNVLDIDPERPNQSLAQVFAAHGPIVKLNLPSERIFVANYALAKDAFNEKNFEKAVSGPLAQVRHAVGDGLFTALPDEHNWAIAHRLLMPAFGPLSIKSMFPEMQDVVSQMVLKWARFGPEERIDSSGDFTRLTLDSIAICAMGSRFNSFYHESQHEFVEAMTATLAEAFTRSRRPPLSSVFFSKQDQLFQEDIEKLENIAKDLLRARREHPTEKRDLLNAMINNKDPKTGETLDETTIIRNMITFLIAGHETTSGLLSFLFYELMANPPAYLKLQAEIDKVVGQGPITMEHMGKLPYVEACLRETLRLHPTAPAFSLTAKGDQVLGGEYQIRDQQVVTIFLSGLHRDKAVYGEDAEDFRPDRMLDEAFKKLPLDSWKPFGNGVRACIGRPFAWQEAILTVATLIQTFHFTKADPSYQLAIKTTLTIKPEHFYLKVKPRDDEFLERAGLLSSEPAHSEKKSGHKSAANVDQYDLKPLQILFGSNTGTCEAVAQSLATAAQEHGFKAEPQDMDSGLSSIDKNHPLIIVTASYEGQPPDNAGHFVEWLSTNPKQLQGVQFAVFGLGNKEWYATYQKIPTVVDEGLERSGGKRIAERVALDVAASNVFDTLDDWSEKTLWPALGSKSIEDAGARELKLEVDVQGRSTALKQDMKHGEVVGTRLLTTKEGAARKRHIAIRLPSGVTYRAGDYLAVLPTNPPETVKRVMKRFALPWDAMVMIDKSAVTFLPKDKQLSVHDILSAMVELSQPVTGKLVATLIKCVADEKHSQELQGLAKDDKKLKALSLLDLLEKYPSAGFSFGAFLAAMPAMRVRQYSISSSPLSDPSVVTLTWSVIDAPDKSGRANGNFLGVCSTYLERLSPGDWLQIALRPSRTGFHTPSDDKAAMIMACAGTGLAPFRAFVSERAIKKEQGSDVGPALLFYGLNAPDEDDMYREEFDKWEKQGVVSVRRAFTFAPDQSKGCKFVQERIWEDRDEVADMFRKGAQVYLCGAGIVGVGVEQAMAKIRRQERGCSEEEAKAWVAEQKGGRYWADVFS